MGFGKKAAKIAGLHKDLVKTILDEDSSILEKIGAVIKFVFLVILVIITPTFLISFLLGILLIVVILAGAAGIIYYFDKEEEKMEEFQIDWADYKCTCEFLSPSDIAKVRGGGLAALGIDVSAEALNVTGGSVDVGGSDTSGGGGVSGGTWEGDKTGGFSDSNKLSGYYWGNYPLELFTLSTSGERGSSEKDILACVGDKGQAYGLMQLDYRYDLVPFMKESYQLNSTAWSGFAEFQNVSIGDKILVNNQKIIDAFNACYKNYPEEYMKIQPNFMAEKYLYKSNVNKLLADAGIDLSHHSVYVSAALLSCNINCGEVTGTKNFIKAGAKDSMTDAELLNCVYTGWRMYRKSATWASHNHRLATDKSGEEGEALKLLSGDNSAISGKWGTQYGAGWDGDNSVKIAVKHSASSANGTSTTAKLGVEGSNNGNNSGSPSASSAVSESGSASSQSSSSGWKAILSAKECYIGYNGVNDDRHAGDGTTPVGVWKMNSPFGLAAKEDGFPDNYIQVNSSHYWSASNAGVVEEQTSSEHIGDANTYGDVYEYCLDMGYNRSPFVEGRGGALFLHTKGGNKCTSGCVAVDDNDMKVILKNYQEGKAFIAVAQKGGFESIYDAYGTNLSPSGYAVNSNSNIKTFDESKFKLPSDATMLVVIQSDKGHDGTKSSSQKPSLTVTAKYWVFVKSSGGSGSETTKSSNNSASASGTMDNHDRYHAAQNNTSGSESSGGSASANTSANSANAVNSVSSSSFTKYTLSDEDLFAITRLCIAEQGTSEAGIRLEASLLANLYESSRGKGYDTMAKYADNSGWFGFTHGVNTHFSGGGSCSIMYVDGDTDKRTLVYSSNSRTGVGNSLVTAERQGYVKDVLVNGNRCLPNYVDEHDNWGDIKKVEVDGVDVGTHMIKVGNAYKERADFNGEKCEAALTAGKKIHVWNTAGSNYEIAIICKKTNSEGKVTYTDPFGYIVSTYDTYKSQNKILNPYKFSGIFYAASITGAEGSAGSGSSAQAQTVSDTLIYKDGDKVSMDSSWEFYDYTKINSGQAVYYRATGTPKNICVAVGAGHGTKGGMSQKTQSHPDGTAMVTSGSNSGTTSWCVSTGTDHADKTPEAKLTLRMAQLLKEMLLKEGYDVLMIRDGDDVQLDNLSRTVMANNVADVFIALHMNDTSKALFTMPPATKESYKKMYPVSVHFEDSWDLANAIVQGWKDTGCKDEITHGGTMGFDLTQTSYSTIPTTDIELIGKSEDHSDDTFSRRLQGVSQGLNTFFQSHSPKNQSKRGTLSGGDSGGDNSDGITITPEAGTVAGGVVRTGISWIALNDPEKLTTSCAIETKGWCGCYKPDPDCMCHIFGGADGILGTSDDGTGSTAQLGTITYVQDERVAKAVEWAKATAADDTHEYRLGASHPDEEQHYDCSSFVTHAYRHAGFDSLKVGTCYDKSIIANFKAAGFQWVEGEPKVEDLLPGDVLVNDSHTEMYIGDNKLVGAHKSPVTINSENKDTTPESSISEIAYHGGWNGYLRYPLVKKVVYGGNGVSVSGAYTADLNGLTASQAAPIIVARAIVDSAMKNLKSMHSDIYTNAVTWIDEHKSNMGNGPLYENTGSYSTDGGKMKATVNGKDYEFRADCSGYMSLVLYLLGAPSTVCGADTSYLSGVSAATLGESNFQVLAFSPEALQPGDIVVTPGKGHTEMCYSYSGGVYKAYNWGSTGGVYNMYDFSTESVRTVPIERNLRNYGHIIRYIGSGNEIVSALQSSGTATNVQTTASLGTSTDRSSLTDGQKISLNASWKYAKESKTNTGQATYYKATNNRKNKCVTINAGHGSPTAAKSANKTFSNPEHSGKMIDGDTNSGALSYGASTGMDFSDMSEARAVVKIAIRLKPLLLDMGYDVLMIREDEGQQDCYMDNICRTVISNNVSDIHVALHFDSSNGNAPAYYILSPENCTYGESQKWYEADKKLGECLLKGLRDVGFRTRAENKWHVNDLTQNVYSCQPSIDIELGDKGSPHDDAAAENYAKGLAKGIDYYLQSN